MSDDKRVDVEFGAKIGGLVAGAREAAAVVRTRPQMKEHGEGLARVFEGVQAHWAALLAIVAGGALFKEAIAQHGRVDRRSRHALEAARHHHRGRLRTGRRARSTSASAPTSTRGS
jgi:hypothetical protein